MIKKCKCGNEVRKNARNCLDCHRQYMQQWRKINLLTDEAKRKAIARSYAKVYLKRGKIIKQPCELCKDENSQMHHEDYNKPLLITWLCRKCHLHIHLLEKLNGIHLQTGLNNVKLKLTNPSVEQSLASVR